MAAGLRACENAAFDAAIVDIFLGDDCGCDLIAAMRQRLPGLPIVAMSGMAALESVVRLAEQPNLVCLQKPFRPADLLAAIDGARGVASSKQAASA
jgi:DNA-binding NtrC family response regulator